MKLVKQLNLRVDNLITSAAVLDISSEKLQGNQDHAVVTLFDQKVLFLVRFRLDIALKSSQI